MLTLRSKIHMHSFLIAIHAIIIFIFFNIQKNNKWENEKQKHKPEMWYETQGTHTTVRALNDWTFES